MPVRSRLAEALHILALSALAVAQPIYDLIGRNAGFLVAHHAGPGAITRLVLALSVGVPLALIGVVGLARLLGRRVRVPVHLAVIGALVALLAAVALAGAPVHPFAIVAIAAAAGIAGTWAYARWDGARQFLTVLSPAAIIFPLVFLLATPVSRLAFPKPLPAEGLRVAPNSPVVVVLFDELSTFALLDAQGRIDRERFPTFAALADTAWWFPNATAASSHTQAAIPPMLTGVAGADGTLPIAADHPRNLFTWLGGAYRLHVLESVTALCPRSLCSTTAASDDTLDARGLASDVAVLYLHLIVPRKMAARHLPPVTLDWKGFAERTPGPPPAAQYERDELDIMRRLEDSTRQGRDGIFRRFVAEIDGGGDSPPLHFIHSSLPHHPYHYLRSGHAYSPGIVAEGLDPGGVWSTDDALVTTGHRQYLEQVMLVDRLLGELIARMKDTGLFDRALLIVTSDHGAAFWPGESHRSVTQGNYRDLSAVPTFVKLPHQHEATVDGRQVSLLDLVPTMASVIDAQVPWQVAGRSWFDTAAPERRELAFRDSRGAPLPVFDVREAAREPQRRRRLEAALAAAWPPDRSEVIGRRIDELNVSSETPDIQVVSDSFVDFRKVEPSSAFVPALVRGYIEGGSGGAALELAIAVNGTIRAVTRTSAWNSQPRYFGALVPGESFAPGPNTLEIAWLQGSGTSLRAARMPPSLAAGMELAGAPGGEYLLTAEGTRVPLTNTVGGWVDMVQETPSVLRLHGWAADQPRRTAVRVVAAFAGKSPVGFAVPAGERPDVTAALGLPAGTKTFFMIEIPIARLRAGPIRVLGVSTNGGATDAGELLVQPAAAATLAKFR